MLPAVVSQYLDQLDASRVQPYVLHLDAEYRLLESWGDASALGLIATDVAADTPAALPFLTGLTPDGIETLYCIDVGTGHSVNAHVLPDSAGCIYLVLISAEQHRRQNQLLQQRANEAKLLYQRQQKLIDQLVVAKTELELRRHEAEEATRGKSQFLASMSHEFRTPLTSVIGYAEWLTRAMDDNDPARRQAGAIVRAGRHMVALVDNILEQARLENAETTIHRDTVDVRQLAEDMSAIMAPLAAEKGLGFAAFLEPQDVQPVILDEMRVRQILINLLGNAVKFTDEGQVQLTLSWLNDQLHAEVADSGPGIAEADRSRIFSAFERVDGAHTRCGAGLGLHITSQLVELLGGSIGLDSRPGEGSRFHVRLPAPPAPVGETGGTAAVSGGRLVIAEDDPDIVQLLELFLTRAGYILEFADNGRDAVERVRRGQPDLVILDLNMPVLDGIGTVQALRDGGHTGPVIALTGATLDEDRIRAISAGFDGFVTKPIRMPELIATIRTLIA